VKQLPKPTDMKRQTHRRRHDRHDTGGASSDWSSREDCDDRKEQLTTEIS